MTTAHVICYRERGKPLSVLNSEIWDLPVLGPKDVLVRMKAAPINPADINAIEGTYGKLSELPAIGGLEGAGEVAQIGSDVTTLKVGQLVVIAKRGLGTWRDALVVEESDVIAVEPPLLFEQAATISVNPATALRMLRDFGSLQPGDWIIQNAANSAVGRHVIQLARYFNYRTINIVRNRSLIDELVAEGGDVVISSDQDIKTAIRDSQAGGQAIALGFNAVGGASALQLTKTLSPGGTLVTYGAMGLRPITIPNGLMIFKELHLCGFWMTRWYERASHPAVKDMFSELAKLFHAGVLKLTVEKQYPIDSFKEAIQHAMQSGRRGKILFRLS